MQIETVLRYLVLRAQAVVLMALGRTSCALKTFESMLLLRPSDSYSLASLAHLQAAQQDFEAAIKNLRRLTDVWPNDAPAWFNLGYVLQQTGRHEEAEPAFHHALALDPLMDRAWYGLGLALMHRQQFLQAAEALKKNTVLQPMSPYGWYRLAEVWLALGQPDEAHKVLCHLHQFEPAVARQLERCHPIFLSLPKVPDAAH